jgi:hypothetical protein
MASLVAMASTSAQDTLPRHPGTASTAALALITVSKPSPARDWLMTWFFSAVLFAVDATITDASQPYVQVDRRRMHDTPGHRMHACPLRRYIFTLPRRSSRGRRGARWRPPWRAPAGPSWPPRRGRWSPRRGTRRRSTRAGAAPRRRFCRPDPPRLAPPRRAAPPLAHARAPPPPPMLDWLARRSNSRCQRTMAGVPLYIVTSTPHYAWRHGGYWLPRIRYGHLLASYIRSRPRPDRSSLQRPMSLS